MFPYLGRKFEQEVGIIFLEESLYKEFLTAAVGCPALVDDTAAAASISLLSIFSPPIDGQTGHEQSGL